MKQRLWHIKAVLMVVILITAGPAVALRCRCAVPTQKTCSRRSCPNLQGIARLENSPVRRCRQSTSPSSRPNCPRKSNESPDQPCCMTNCPHALLIRERIALLPGRPVRPLVARLAHLTAGVVHVTLSTPSGGLPRLGPCDLGPGSMPPGQSPQALLATFRC